MKRMIGIVLLVLLIVAALSGCALAVPSPEIKSGEFAFSVTYELGGEIKTISGVYVCEYQGADWAIDSDLHRSWEGYVKNVDIEKFVTLGVAEDGGEIRINLDLFPEYFMGEDYEDWRNAPTPWLQVVIADEDGGISIDNEAEVIEDTYGAKIIGYEYDQPIENTFGLFK